MANIDGEQKPEAVGTDTRRSRDTGKLLLFVVVGLLAAGLIVTTTLLLSGRGTGAVEQLTEGRPAESGGKPADEAQAAKPPPVYLELDPPFVVNLNEPGEIRFLQVSVSLMARDGAALDRANAQIPLLRHHLVVLFSDQRFEELRSSEGKARLQIQARELVRQVLTETLGEPLVEEVYLTSIVGQ